MRLLVTNNRNPQAYSIIRALRDYAEWIVATVTLPRALGFWPTDHAAYSRLVDRRFAVPDPEADWHAGRIQAENTPNEQRFVDTILEICERERINTIFPSIDPYVYVFAKNKKVFEDRGILLPIPDLDVVLRPLDKYETMRIAQAVGFPSPRTWLPGDELEVGRLARELPGPWVLKPRFTTGARGTYILTDAAELRARFRAVSARHGRPILQEYIQGLRRQSFYITLDRAGGAFMVMTPEVTRVTGRFTRNGTASCRSVDPVPFSDEAVNLVRAMGWWGGATVQAKYDPRDGLPKLMEVNPRLGAHVWYRTALGVNEPLLCIRAARGERAQGLADYPRHCLLLEPIEDAAGFVVELADALVHRIRTRLLGRPPVDPLGAPRTLAAMLRSIRAEYFGRRERRLSPHARHFFSDPLPALIWSSKVAVSRMKMLGEGIGR